MNNIDNMMPDMSQDIFPQQIALAMAYVPMQRFENLYDEKDGFYVGTVFASLDLPFKGGRG